MNSSIETSSFHDHRVPNPPTGGKGDRAGGGNVFKIWRAKVIQYYCFIFYGLMIFKWVEGMFLYQRQPAFFLNHIDVFMWLFMQTHIHLLLLNNPGMCILFDAVFFSMPLLFLCADKFVPAVSVPAALLMLVVNWLYVQCYSLYSFNPPEGEVALLVIPLLFLTRKEMTFKLVYEGLRYYFIFIFLSSGLWKFYQGGIFHLHEMSGVLLYQHNQLITNSPGYWETKLYLWLIARPAISYGLYAASTVIELSFFTGFFTKKYDYWLAGGFVLFLIADQLIMRIPYFILLPFLIMLLLPVPATSGKDKTIVPQL